MKTMASAEMPRKKGRRTDSCSSWRRPQAPPRLRANMKETVSLMTSMRWSMYGRDASSSRPLAHALVPRSSAREMIETTPRKT